MKDCIIHQYQDQFARPVEFHIFNLRADFLDYLKRAEFVIPLRDEGHLVGLVEDEKSAPHRHHGILRTDDFPIYVSPFWVEDLGSLTSRWIVPYT